MTMRLAVFALWIGLAAATGKPRHSIQRRLPLTDLFVAPTPKTTKKNGGEEMPTSEGGGNEGDNYYYYYYYDDPYYNSKKKGGKMSGGKGGGKGGKGKGSSGYYYDDYYPHRPTHAPLPSKTPYPTYPPKQWPPPTPNPPKKKSMGGMGMKSMGSKNYYYDHGKKDDGGKMDNPGKQPTPHPQTTRPPNYVTTRAPDASPNPPSSPTRAPTLWPPTPTTSAPNPAPNPPPSPTGPPTAAPVAVDPSTSAPTSSPVAAGGPTVIQLTDFSLEYDIAPVVIPPIEDVEAVAQVTADFLRGIFEAEFPGLASLGLNYVGEDLSFPTYTIDYEVVATVTDDTTRDELDAVLNSAFQGANLQTYLELIQALPEENSFSRVTGIRKVDTPDTRSNPAGPVEGSSSNITGGLPVPLLAAAGAASFALIVLGITLNRREKAAMREGKPDKNHRADITVAGDTYAGETFAETINSAGSKGGRSQSSLGRPGYESAVRTFGISSSESEQGYVTESDYESGYEEEEKVEIDDAKSLSDASFSKYGGVVPVDGTHLRKDANESNKDALLRGVAAGTRQAHSDEDSASLNSTIRSGGSRESLPRDNSSDSGSTSIHLLEAASSDDDDLKRASQVRQAFNSYYSRPGEIQIQIPSVETDDYEEIEEMDTPRTDVSGVALIAEEETQSQRSFDHIASQLGKDLQRELKREPEQLRPIQERQPDPPQELPDEASRPARSRPRCAPKPPKKEQGNDSGVAALIQRFN